MIPGHLGVNYLKPTPQDHHLINTNLSFYFDRLKGVKDDGVVSDTTE